MEVTRIASSLMGVTVGVTMGVVMTVGVTLGGVLIEDVRMKNREIGPGSVDTSMLTGIGGLIRPIGAEGVAGVRH